ncbi:prenyltransferase/squalene oxidase repeat-containing protein [Haloferula sp.]|uniref:prenyltransferase/squalene oxidase repeat-containing protein n=1 Tax=Haloferula sp. TaxID=2497595 RepID=UPI00329E3520
MSLHAQLSPEARDALDRQRRSTRATSIIVAILGTTLLALVLGFFGLKIIVEPKPSSTTVIKLPEVDDPPIDPPTVTRRSQASAPSSIAPPVLSVDIPSPVSIPTVEVSTVDTTGFGEDGDFGLGAGDDFGSGQGDPGLIRRMPGKRCSKQERLALLQESGATAATDDQVVKALRFMKNTQAADGGWGNKNRAAMTGLALLAYLGHCETPHSEEFGESCLRAIVFLTDRGMKKKGRLADSGVERHWPYEQAIATYALAEAETMCRGNGIRVPRLREVVQQAGQLIIDSQHRSGGWDYSYDEAGKRGGDLSITGWHVQALKACKLSGIDFRNLERSAKKALDYVGERQADDGGFGYTGTRAAGELRSKSLTGVGMLSFQMWGQGSKSAVRRGAKYALEEMPIDWNSPDCDLYAHYYLAQAMFQRGGSEWSRYQPAFHRAISEHQSDDGSWPVPGSGEKIEAAGALFTSDTADGRHYRTALATLMLEVYYRYLPASK